MELEKIGRYAFILGLIISVIAGFANIGTVGNAALVILGIIVGIINVTGKEVESFLIGTIALMLVGNGINILGIAAITNIIQAFVAFVAGAALIVALKVVYTITKGK